MMKADLEARWADVERAVRALRREHERSVREGRRADRLTAAAGIAVLLLIAAALVFAGCGAVTVDPSVVPDAGADVGSAGRQVEGGSGGAGGEPAPPADAAVACWTTADLGAASCGTLGACSSSTCFHCSALPGCARARSSGGILLRLELRGLPVSCLRCGSADVHVTGTAGKGRGDILSCSKCYSRWHSEEDQVSKKSRPGHVCPGCGAWKFYGVGPVDFPELNCGGCGISLGWNLGTNPAILILRNQHDTAPAQTSAVPSKVPTEYQMPPISDPQVSGKIETHPGVVGSSPAAPTPPNPASFLGFAPLTDGPDPQSTNRVPSPHRGPVPGTPLCGRCATREKLLGRRSDAQGLKCVFCGLECFHVVHGDPVVASPHVVLPEGTPEPKSPRRFTQPDRAADMIGCEVMSCGENARWVTGDGRHFCHEHVDARGVGQPFGVDIAKVGAWWNCQVRNAKGNVAYVRVGEPTADAARWAALSHLRSYARDVAAADSEALRAAFSAESLRIEPPTVADALAASDANDPLAVLMAAKMREPLRDRLLAELKARERRWEDLAEDPDADAYTVALAKDAADCDAAALLRLAVGE